MYWRVSLESLIFQKRSNASQLFLWGHVKSMVYASKATTLQELRANSAREILVVTAEKCEQAIENWVQRIDRFRRARVGCMNKVEFHA